MIWRFWRRDRIDPIFCEQWRKVWAITNDEIRGTRVDRSQPQRIERTGSDASCHWLRVHVTALLDGKD